MDMANQPKPQDWTGSDVPDAAGLLTESGPTAWVQDFAAYAASLFIGSAGIRICGTPDRIRMQFGIVLAPWLGSFGTHRTARLHSCVGSKGGAAARQVDGYGKALKASAPMSRSFNAR